MPSLCETCENVRAVCTARSRFLLCRLSATNAAYPKYPPQPVMRCDGYRSRKYADERSVTHMLSLYHDPHFTFRFADDRIIPRFHLEGVEAGRRVAVYKIDPRYRRAAGPAGGGGRGRRRLGGLDRADHRAGR